MIGNWRSPLAIFLRGTLGCAAIALIIGAFYTPSSVVNDVALRLFVGGLACIPLAIALPRAILREPEPRPLRSEEE